MDKRKVVLAPKARRDLFRFPERDAELIADDLGLLETPPWPASKVKKLKGVDYWELKTGNYRSIFITEGKTVVVLRIINRRDLLRTVKHIDINAVLRWLRSKK